jgi:3-oxoadipate enol-lactonase
MTFLDWPGGGVPVVCLSGIGGAAHLWGATARALRDPRPIHRSGDAASADRARAPRRVLAWNQPGYGGRALVEPLDFATLADTLAADLEAAGVAQADLVGHSMGGMIAIEFALRHPARLRRLVPYATTPAFGGKDPTFAQQFLERRLAPLERGMSMAQAAGFLVSGMAAAGADPATEPAMAAAMAMVPEATWRATLACLTRFDRRADIGAIAAPTLCIAGAQDAIAPPRTMQRMADAIPGARCVEIAGAGHVPHLEQPAAFEAALSGFLADI